MLTELLCALVRQENDACLHQLAGLESHIFGLVYNHDVIHAGLIECGSPSIETLWECYDNRAFEFIIRIPLAASCNAMRFATCKIIRHEYQLMVLYQLGKAF
jgi:hypothetical protein